jgi:uncharacterized membrane protein YphA (DoxX/SURF4 family)
MVHMSPQKKAYVWTVSVLIGFLMVFTGLPKVFGGQDWTRNFELWGYPDWMRVLVGWVEVMAGILLVWPRSQLFAAGALMVIMAGAFYTRLVYGDFRQWAIPLVIMLLLASIVYARWPHPTEETGKLDEPIEPDNDDEESPVAAR